MAAQTQRFYGINESPGDNELILFTPQYDEDTGTDNTVSEVLVELSRPALIIPTPNMVTGIVKEIRQNAGSTPIPFDHVVLSARGTAATTLLNYADLGDTIGISQEITSYDLDCNTPRSLDWTKSYGAVSGNWVCLKDGVIQYGVDSTGLRHPRTAIALNDDYVFFIVCDGRSGISIGMTIDELAEFCKYTLGGNLGFEPGRRRLVDHGGQRDSDERSLGRKRACGFQRPYHSQSFAEGSIQHLRYRQYGQDDEHHQRQAGARHQLCFDRHTA